MQLIRISSKVAAIVAAAILAIAVASCSGSSDSAYAGKYKTADTQGKEMTITLVKDGSAMGEREGESLKGTWKEDGGAAMVTWDETWSTKISKEGDKYMKTAYKDGKQDGEPVSAEKVE